MGKGEHFTSWMMCCAGALLTFSALLMGICAGLIYGVLCGVGAFCLFLSALNFYKSENSNESEEMKDE